ncbi:MAG: hypothetical protein C0602_04750 [Denitrovibrio sp.]|nr:MAG: hypothetical protein C0602_04750 [Denitrovibrio sp.]
MSANSGKSEESFLYSLHPAVKLFVFICVIQMTSVANSPLSFIFFSLLFAGLTAYSGISLKLITSKIKPFLLILVAAFAINLAFSGLELAAVFTFRFFLIILFSLLLTITSDPKSLVAVMLYPFKGLHGSNLRVVFLVAMEFIPVFISEAKNIGLSIKEQYKGKTYKAIFKPELYIKPMAAKLAEMSAGVAEDVEKGNYTTPSLSKPQVWETAFALCMFALAVKYAL